MVSANRLLSAAGQRLPVERDRHRLIDAVVAVRALRDLRGARVPVRGRHVPGTRQHAVAAADALVDVIPHRTVGLPLQRRRRAGGNAGRLQAVEAPLHDVGGIQASRLRRVLHLVERDERVRLRAEHGRVLEAQVGLQLRSSSPSRSFHCLHATWHARQPMQLAMSMRVVLVEPASAGVVMCVPSVLRIFVWRGGLRRPR